MACEIRQDTLHPARTAYTFTYVTIDLETMKFERHIVDLLSKALLVTLDTETKFEREGLLIEAVPYWKYWSIRAKVS